MLEKALALDDFAKTEILCELEKADTDGLNVDRANEKHCVKAKLQGAEAAAVEKDLEIIRRTNTSLEAEYAFLLSQYRFYRALGIAFGLFGFIICILGFWLWYIRLQRYLDIEARSSS